MSDVLISDFSSTNPMDTLYGTWFWLSEFPRLTSFNADGVQGQMTYSGTIPGVGIVAYASASGGASRQFPPLDLSGGWDLSLTARLLPDNQATEIQALLGDADGSTLRWVFPAVDFNSTTFATVSRPLAEGTLVALGSQPGFDWSRTTGFAMQGNYLDLGGAAFIGVQFDTLLTTVPEPAAAAACTVGLLTAWVLLRGRRRRWGGMRV